MKIITWNVNGFRSVVQKGDFDKILKLSPDIICLQELKLSSAEVLSGLLYSNYHVEFNLSLSKGKSGVAIFSKKPPNKVNKKIGLERFDGDGRLLELSFSDFALVNVYMPHGRRDQADIPYKIDAYNCLINFVAGHKRLIIIGDFNIAETDLDLERYKSNRNNTMFTIVEREKLTSLKTVVGFDSFRNKYPGKRQYTWFPYAFDAKVRNLGWRIDYAFLSEHFSKINYDIYTLMDIEGSDHCPILLDIDI